MLRTPVSLIYETNQTFIGVVFQYCSYTKQVYQSFRCKTQKIKPKNKTVMKTVKVTCRADGYQETGIFGVWQPFKRPRQWTIEVPADDLKMGTVDINKTFWMNFTNSDISIVEGKTYIDGELYAHQEEY